MLTFDKRNFSRSSSIRMTPRGFELLGKQIACTLFNVEAHIDRRWMFPSENASLQGVPWITFRSAFSEDEGTFTITVFSFCMAAPCFTWVNHFLHQLIYFTRFEQIKWLLKNKTVRIVFNFNSRDSTLTSWFQSVPIINRQQGSSRWWKQIRPTSIFGCVSNCVF